MLAVSTVVAGVAIFGYSTSQLARQQALAQLPTPQQPRAAPRLRSGDELARRPMGEYITVQCDFVQNSDHGRLRRVTLCLVGQHILAVAGGNRLHDSGRLLQGYVEAIPNAQGPSWASALRKQILEDPRYYDFYLRRLSYGDDTPDDAEEEADRRDDDPRFALRPDHRGEKRADGDNTDEALIRALAVTASLATLAGWFVWIRLWQLRRRVATWIVTG